MSETTLKPYNHRQTIEQYKCDERDATIARLEREKEEIFNNLMVTVKEWKDHAVAAERELAEAQERGKLQETKLHNECQAHERTKRKLARWHRAFADVLVDKEINTFDVPPTNRREAREE